MHSLIFSGNPKLHHNVNLFDVGHGASQLIFDQKKKGLLVDIGTLNHLQYYQKIPKWIENFCPKNNNTGLVISHYHCDHYNLFKYFSNPSSLFSEIYLPMIPTSGNAQEIGFAIYDYLQLAYVSRYKKYRILSDLFRRFPRRPIICQSGKTFKEANLSWKVIWPDLGSTIFNLKIEIARAVREITESLMSRLKIPIAVENENLKSIDSFFEFLWKMHEKELTEEENTIVWKTLTRLEDYFKTLGNSISLVFRTNRAKYSRFLFLGDLEKKELDVLKIPGKPEYDCVTAAHHGTTFGSSLSKLKTEYLLISRNQKRYKSINPINSGYLLNMNVQKILSTEHLGTCLIL